MPTDHRSDEQGRAGGQRPEGGRAAALDALFWRDEILQVLFWMQGEGLSDDADVAALGVFLNGDADTIAFHLEKMVGDGLLVRASRGDGAEGAAAEGAARYMLTEDGRREAARRFSDAFEGLQKQGHGECSADCMCQWEGPAACTAHHHHPHE